MKISVSNILHEWLSSGYLRFPQHESILPFATTIRYSLGFRGVDHTTTRHPNHQFWKPCHADIFPGPRCEPFFATALFSNRRRRERRDQLWRPRAETQGAAATWLWSFCLRESAISFSCLLLLSLPVYYALAVSLTEASALNSTLSDMDHEADALRTDLMTLTRHVLNEQSKYPESRGDFTILLSHIVLGCKFVCSAVNKVHFGVVDAFQIVK